MSSSSVPDSFSMKQLNEMLAEAQKDAERHSPETSYEDQVIQVAFKHCENALKEMNDPMVHKTMMVQIIDNLVSYHVRQSQASQEAGENDRALYWMRDAGALMAARAIVANVGIAPNDFIAGTPDDPTDEDQDGAAA